MTNRTDNFNRTDTTNNIGTPSDGGSAWVQAKGTWGIFSNTSYESSNTTDAVAVLESSVADVDVQATIGGSPNTNFAVLVREVDTSNYLLWTWTTAVGLRMFKNVAGSFTQLGSTVTYTPSAGDVFKFSVSGSTLNGYVNGTLKVGPITDSAGSTNTKHGMYRYQDATTTFDDFSITGTAGGATRPVKMAGRWCGYAGASGGFAG